MRVIVAAVIACGCQQQKPEPPPAPAVVRDAAAIVLMDGPRTFHDLTLGDRVERVPTTASSPERTAAAPRVWSLAGDVPDGAKGLLFDGPIVAITRIAGHPADEQAWLVELGDAAREDRALRSFAVQCPASVGIDLHVGQRIHGQFGWTDQSFCCDTARIDDEDGIVIALDPAEPAYRIGKKTTGFPIMDYEEARRVEANFGGTVWTPLAGWSHQKLRAGDYEVYGLATELRPDRSVTDYVGSTTFAMFRVPARALP